jgi:hypothetical protein
VDQPVSCVKQDPEKSVCPSVNPFWVILGNFWQFGQFLAIFGNFWQFWAILGNSGRFLDNFGQNFGNFWQFFAEIPIFGMYETTECFSSCT